MSDTAPASWDDWAKGAGLGTDDAPTPLPAPEPEAETPTTPEAEVETEEAPEVGEQESEAPSTPSPFKYKYNREEFEVDLDRLKTDEAYRNEMREYIERGRAVDRTDERVAKAKQEAFQQAGAWLKTQGFEITPEGTLRQITKQAAQPEESFEDLLKRAKDGDADAIAASIKALHHETQKFRQQQEQAAQQAQARATQEQVHRQIEERLAQHAAVFDASPQSDAARNMARRAAWTRVYEKDAQWEDVLGEIDNFASFLDTDRKHVLKKAPTPPAKVKAPPVPTSGSGARPKPTNKDDIDWSAQDKGAAQVADFLRSLG